MPIRTRNPLPIGRKLGMGSVGDSSSPKRPVLLFYVGTRGNEGLSS